MSRELMTAMKLAISEVMDKMFFMPVNIYEKQGALNGWFSGKDPIIGATLDFTGPQTGFSYLLMPNQLAIEITANFLGYPEDSINEKHEKDTVKEALNMIVGYTLSQFDKKDAFKIGIPQHISEINLLSGEIESSHNCSFSIESNNNCLVAGLVMKIP